MGRVGIGVRRPSRTRRSPCRCRSASSATSPRRNSPSGTRVLRNLRPVRRATRRPASAGAPLRTRSPWPAPAPERQRCGSCMKRLSATMTKGLRKSKPQRKRGAGSPARRAEAVFRASLLGADPHRAATIVLFLPDRDDLLQAIDQPVAGVERFRPMRRARPRSRRSRHRPARRRSGAPSRRHAVASGGAPGARAAASRAPPCRRTPRTRDASRAVPHSRSASCRGRAPTRRPPDRATAASSASGIDRRVDDREALSHRSPAERTPPRRRRPARGPARRSAR